MVLWRGVQLEVRRWDLQGAVAWGAAAELETWSLLPAVCPTRWKQLSVLGHCRSETQAVFVLLGYSWCLSGRTQAFLYDRRTEATATRCQGKSKANPECKKEFKSLVGNNLFPDSYPRFIPDSYPDSYPSAAICSQEPLALWAVLAKLCRPNPQKTQNSKRSTAGTSSRLFSQKFARRWVRKAYFDVPSATRYTTCKRPTGLCAAAV